MSVMSTGIGSTFDPEPPTPDGGPAGPAAPGEAWAAPLLHATGALLVVLVPLHLVGLLLDPANMSVLSLIHRWENPAWLLVDWSLLVVGVLHGLVAVWLWVGRSGLSPSRQTTVMVGVGGPTVALFVLASWSMLFLV